MIIKFYNDEQLAYANRRRYRDISSFNPFAEVTYHNVTMGDGAATSIKVKVEYLCNYVTMELKGYVSRWFVNYYIYLNGGQVQLFLQRDVIGEFGLNGCIGNIERGLTNTFLKNKKELSVNQILKKRTYLLPPSTTYGNYTVSTHDNEMWGVLYFTKPSGINPETGEPYSNKVSIPIPAYTPENYVSDYDELPDTTSYYNTNGSTIGKSFNYYIALKNKIDSTYYYFEGNVDIISGAMEIYSSQVANGQDHLNQINNSAYVIEAQEVVYPYEMNKLLNAILTKIREYCITNNVFEDVPDNKVTINGKAYSVKKNTANFDNKIVKVNNDFFKYTVEDNKTGYVNYGSVGKIGRTILTNKIGQLIHFDNKDVTVKYIGTFIEDVKYGDEGDIIDTSLSYRNFSGLIKYNRVQITAAEAGQIEINLSQQLIDEPYYITVCPLYDVEIKGTKTYNVTRVNAFTVFNALIEGLSGENGYVVDAQIFPYCPELDNVDNEFRGIPFFRIRSNTYSFTTKTQLLPYKDVKKEYIQREYSIIAPDQSSKFTFQFYDYYTGITSQEGTDKNTYSANITIKVSLKPFNIVTAAVINPDINSLVGQTYVSDLRGCMAKGNGFECSLASNTFETYKRQNSNFQSLFDIDVQELQKQHKVELANDIVSTVMNTAAGTMYGAVAGKAAADTSIFGINITGAAGAVAGGVAGGATVGAAMTAQTVLNEGLRDYEEKIQKQRFDLNIGTIKNLPNSVNRISSFNEIIMRDFWYVIETYDCSDAEGIIVDNFIKQYSYLIGIIGNILDFVNGQGSFIRSTLIRSPFAPNLAVLASNDLTGGIYYYEQI